VPEVQGKPMPSIDTNSRSATKSIPAEPGGRRLALDIREPDSGSVHHIELELGAGRVYHVIAKTHRTRAAILEQLVQTGFAAIVPADGGLINNLKIWENMVLPAAYHGSPRYAALEERAAAILAKFDIAGDKFSMLCSSLPGNLGRFDRRLCAFVRALLTEPGLLVYDSVYDGLTREETEKVLAFDPTYRHWFPLGTSLHLTADLHVLPDFGAHQSFTL
jgi:ABC-type multidrug transport system ATPase subunit